MAKSRGIILVLAISAVVITAALPCRAAGKNEKEDQSIWTEDQDKGPGPGPGQGPGPGPERGPRRGGPGRERFDLTDEEINRIMEGLKERSPEKAKELENMREKDPERFQQELRRHASDEFGKVVRERMEKRMEKWREQRHAEFIEWLQKSLPKEAEELAKLKDRDTDLYGKKYEVAWRNYGRIFEESRRSPELAEVLMEDLKLQKRTEELSAKIKAAKNESEKKKLTADLEEVVGLRYDLIVRKKQIAYEWLLKRLEELQNHIKESRAELGIWQDPKTKAENVKERVEYLLEEKKGFSWD
jgi:hypothetical protein